MIFHKAPYFWCDNKRPYVKLWLCYFDWASSLNESNDITLTEEAYEMRLDIM